MEYVTLTGTGLRVSRACMGTMTFGGQADEPASFAMVDRALEAGINFFDTADIYTEGRSETITGKALAGRRQDLILASKVRGQVGSGPNDLGLSRKHILEALENSLRRLGTDYLDIYYLHMPDYETPLAETLATMNDLVRAGKVRYVGISNYASWQMLHALWICDKRGLEPPLVAQQMYNLIARGIEQEQLRFCAEFGVGIVAYNPLAGGMLTGKHDDPAFTQPNTRFDGNKMYRDRYWHEANFEAVKALAEIARKAGKSLVELSLQWILAHKQVDCVLLGASRMEQLDEDLAAMEGTLDQETMAACDEVWKQLRGPSPQYNR
jgi:1-deoxyxylulose-5-phosphate synthase